jgi:phage virion morphogenesis protein
MTTIHIRYDGRERLAKRLAKIRERSGDLEPALNDCREIMLSSIEENFLQGGRYESVDSVRGGTKRWQDLSQVTKDARKKKGKWPGKILQVSGQLAASITGEVNRNDLEIGTNKVQGALMQFGGPAGKNKSVDVPGRPYLVVQDEDVDDMLDVTGEYITGD